MFSCGHCQELLSTYPVLEKYADKECLEVFREAQVAAFDPGTTMFHEESPCSNFMWLLEGSVRIFKNSEEGREVTIYRVLPGELCLLSLNSLFGGYSYPASPKSETHTKGLIISAVKFHHLMEKSRGFRQYVLQALTERLSNVISLISAVSFRRLDLRLACLLGQQFERSGGVALKITRAELACELGTTREVINRILKEFKHQQCISLKRGQIHLVSPDGLEWFSSEVRKAG